MGYPTSPTPFLYQVISLDDAPKGYFDFDKGAAKKYVIDPHGSLRH